MIIRSSHIATINLLFLLLPNIDKNTYTTYQVP